MSRHIELIEAAKLYVSLKLKHLRNGSETIFPFNESRRDFPVPDDEDPVSYAFERAKALTSHKHEQGNVVGFSATSFYSSTIKDGEQTIELRSGEQKIHPVSYFGKVVTRSPEIMYAQGLTAYPQGVDVGAINPIPVQPKERVYNPKGELIYTCKEATRAKAG
jgi:hypothetical protein